MQYSLENAELQIAKNYTMNYSRAEGLLAIVADNHYRVLVGCNRAG
jgi:hypothetical protein